MIGPTSDTGKAMLQSLMQQVQAGMPVDQAIQYVKSQAAVGVAPLVDLYALLNQFQRMKQPPVQPPTGGTIKQQLDALEAMKSGLGGMQPQATPPMQQGLGGLNAGAMENPQFNAAGGGVIGYVGGGTVAFGDGGKTDKKAKPEYSYETMYNEADAKDDMSVEGLEEYLSKLDPIQQKLAIGKYAPSLKMKESDLTRRESAIAADAEQQRKLDEAAYYGDIGEFSAEQGSLYKKAPTFIDILARAQKGKAQRAQSAFDKQRTARDAIEKEKILNAEAVEALRKGDFDTYKAKLDAAKAIKDEAAKKMAEATQKGKEDAYSRETQLQVAAANRNTETEKLLRDLRNAKTPEERERIGDLIEIAKGRDAQGTSDRANFGRVFLKAYEALLAAQATGDVDAITAAQAELKRVLEAGPKNLNKLGETPPNVANPQTPTGKSSVTNW